MPNVKIREWREEYGTRATYDTYCIVDKGNVNKYKSTKVPCPD